MLIWISQHQGLLAGLAAAVAAYLTIRKMKEQIQQQEKFRKIDVENRKRINFLIVFTEIIEMQNNLYTLYRNLTGNLPQSEPDLLLNYINPVIPHQEPNIDLPYEIVFDANDASDDIVSDLIFFCKKYRSQISAYNYLNEENAQIKKELTDKHIRVSLKGDTLELNQNLSAKDHFKLIKLENSMRNYIAKLIVDIELAKSLIVRLNKISRKRYPDLNGYNEYEVLEIIEYLKHMPFVEVENKPSA